MALIKCPECGNEVSDQSQICVNCGYPIVSSNPKKKFNKIYLGTIAFFIFIIFIVSLLIINYSKNNNTSAKVELSIKSTESYLDSIYTDFINGQEKVVNAMIDYGNSTTEQDIKDFEFVWVLAVDSFTKDVDILSKNIPAKEYQETWENFEKYLSTLVKLGEPFTDIDTNNDGIYTSKEGDAIYNKYVPEIKETIIDCLEECENYTTLKVTVSTTEPESTSKTGIPKEQETAYKNENICIECGKKASYTYTNPFSYEVENYCYTHYNEIISIMSAMEDDIGKGSYNIHTCEQCSREGTHRYKSFTGQIEYYCTEHYKELQAMLNSFGLN